MVPTAATLAVLLNSKSPTFEARSRDVQEAARAIGQQVMLLGASSDSEIDTAFETLSQQRAGGLVVTADQFFTTKLERLVALAARYAIPTIYEYRGFAAAGGLMSYGITYVDGYRQAGIKTAKALGLMLPPGVLAIADEVIE